MTDQPFANLQGCNLRGVNLTEVNLTGADLTNADLSEATLTFFNLDAANLTGASLADARFSDGSLVNTNLVDVDAQRIVLTRVDAGYSDWSGAVFKGAVMRDVSFGFATLHDAELSRSSFIIVNFNDATLTNVDLRETDASGGTEFYRTNAAGADLGGLNVASTIFADANLQGAVGTPSNTANATFSNVTCPDGTTQNSSCW